MNWLKQLEGVTRPVDSHAKRRTKYEITICVPELQLLKSMQKCQSKMTQVAVSNRLIFLFDNALESIQSCDG